MNKLDLLEDYLDGRLSVSEMKEFESNLVTDEDLAREYRLHRDMEKALLDDKLAHFKRMVDDAHVRYEKMERRPLFFKMAAAFAIFLTIGGILLLFLNKSPSTRTIAERYYQVYQPLNGNRSATPEQELLLTAAFDAYYKSDYLTAARSFETLLISSPENNQVRFFLAMCYMEDKEGLKAADLLQQIIDTRDVFYLNQSEWYLGICYLWLGRKEEAVLPFDRLSKKKGYYQEQAVKILQDISKID